VPTPIPRVRPLDWGASPPPSPYTRTVRGLAHARLVEPNAPPVLTQLGHDTGFDEACCGPTCMVMAGVAWGIIPRSASVRTAILAASRWGGSGHHGTSIQGIGKIADGMGIDFEQRPGVTAAGVRDFLGLGAHVVARGNACALPWSSEPGEDGFSGHVVYIVGEDDRGFVVHDPYTSDGVPRSLTDAQLERFGAKRDLTDRPFIMGVAKMSSGVECRTYAPGEAP
jgi:hypothetical protein